MEDSPGNFFEASKDDQRKYINQLLALVRRFSERPESSNDERLRWSKARFAAAILARATGHMDTATFEAEQGYHAAWIAWAVQGVLCPPEYHLPGVPAHQEPDAGKQQPKPSGEAALKPTPEQVRRAQEYAKQRLLEPPIDQDELIGESKRKLH
jgi:hypothetical protein